ncbi:Glycerophosphodiester phosphodiesterase, cytoplasmic [Tepidimonas alkaliphilus]|uniref:Glycerophosphodiester phosphodiesterase, cytoplasmic n=1 Tax=Tepidimonas alkaliphilus TaxID=2588942 RepID=A0A554WBF6_9BURK|nr:glycerophosphodiester phosphodiesterase [Tepidimonas alkaliphilus]TSE20912.1 Glycerophosphodiester phosphodiesterase, cytoplasmic [Tepidimonas alkaliphilus]
MHLTPAHAEGAWPLPRWIAHRGAGKKAPENTLAAFELGWRSGWRAFECDVKLSADGVPFLLHDATLERTTNGRGPAGALPWAELAQLDAGRWHSPAFAGEPLLRLDRLAAWALERGAWLNLEIKPSPGTETRTGAEVARAAGALWRAHGAGQPGGPAWPLLTSFQPAALQAAQEAAPQLPRGLLLDRLWPGCWAVARSLGCVAVVLNHRLCNAGLLAQLRSMGWCTLAYTVNDAVRAETLLGWGLDAIITDEVETLGPGRPANA